MCGIFGIIGKNQNLFSKLIKYSSARGRDTLGIVSYTNNHIHKLREFNDPKKNN